MKKTSPFDWGPAKHIRAVALVTLIPATGSTACGASAGDSAQPATTTLAQTTTTLNETAAASVINTWAHSPVDRTKLPIGTSHVSTKTADVGGLLVCDAGFTNGGVFKAGPWIDESAGTWDATKKVSVQGKVSWPMAKYREVIDGTSRTITSNGLPVDDVTGTFPIAADDPAFSYETQDQCDGRNSPIVLDGKVTTSYHYSATYEFPYSIGCFHGTAQ